MKGADHDGCADAFENGGCGFIVRRCGGWAEWFGKARSTNMDARTWNIHDPPHAAVTRTHNSAALNNLERTGMARWPT